MIEKNIKIGGLYYKTLEVKDLARDHSALGRCCGNNTTIELDSELKDSVKEKTLIHEIIEAINFEYELDLEHPKISILASAFYQVLVDNKNLFATVNNKEEPRKDHIFDESS